MEKLIQATLPSRVSRHAHSPRDARQCSCEPPSRAPRPHPWEAHGPTVRWICAPTRRQHDPPALPVPAHCTSLHHACCDHSRAPPLNEEPYVEPPPPEAYAFCVLTLLDCSLAVLFVPDSWDVACCAVTFCALSFPFFSTSLSF